MPETNILTPEQQAVQQAQIQAALQAPIQRIYANGFLVAQTATDAFVVLMQNGAPHAILNLSFISAKSLGIDLANLVSQFEKATGEKIPTAQEIGDQMSKTMGPGSGMAKT